MVLHIINFVLKTHVKTCISCIFLDIIHTVTGLCSIMQDTVTSESVDLVLTQGQFHNETKTKTRKRRRKT